MSDPKVFDELSYLREEVRPAKAPRIARIEKELFQINKKTFIINAKDSIFSNIEKVLHRYFRR